MSSIAVFKLEMKFVEVFVMFLMVLVVLMFVRNQYSEVEYVKSGVDNKVYLVRKFPDSQRAADFLAEVNIMLLRLVKHMMAKYPDNKEIVQLYKNFNPESVSEGSVDSGYTSYSVNKGEKLILCIRQRDGSFVDKNIVMYVAIHELAHIMTTEIGHTPTFWSNFKMLLNEAIDLGLYHKVDYNNKPQDYCGIKITNSIV